MLKQFISLSIFIGLSFSSFAQAVLPSFSVKKGAQNHAIISWHNNFGDNITMLNIQRSTNEKNNFHTIYSAENPGLEINAFTDNKPKPSETFYRIYYTTKNGQYIFTKAQEASTGYVTDALLEQFKEGDSIHVNGTQSRIISFGELKTLKDSVLFSTPDSLLYMDKNTVSYRKYTFAEQVTTTTPTQTIPSSFASNYLYQNVDGNIVIRLPSNEVNAYSMIIYQRDGNAILYKIDHFDNAEIILSKSSFMHAGWYPYMIYENGKLKEKNKFQVK